MKLYDGREKFYQYDTNQKLICEDCAVGEEIHFSNSAHGDAAICLTYDLDGTVVVNVPNIYLMYAVELNVYSMRTEDDGRCTISRHVFGVIPRKKPSDYVYEETEVKSYAELDRRIKKLEENAGAGIDIVGATAGQVAQIAEVDENGVPTVWRPADLPKVEIPPLIVSMTPKNGQWVADRTRSEIVAHVEKGGSVGLAAINNLNAYYWSHNDQYAIFRDVRTATARAYTIYYYIDESGVCTDKTQDYTPPAMTGATADADGVSGVVPAPAAGDEGKYLRGDGTWGDIDIPEGGGGGISQDELQAAVNAAIEQAKAGLLVFEDSYVDDTANWLTNGYTKVSQTATSGHPPQCTGSDKWGVLFFIAENAANGTGTHMYFPIDGTYKGRVFTRSVTRRVPGEWYLLSTMDDIPTGGGGGGGADHTLGLSGAAVGQIARITAVDGNGVPTAWDSVDLPAGGSGGEKWDIHYKTNIAEPLAEGFEITEVDGEPLQLKEMWAMVKLQNGSETQQWLGCVVKTDNADLSGTASDYGGAYTGVGKYAYFVYHAIVIGNGRAVCEIRFGENRASKLNFCTNGPWLNNWLDHNRVQYIKGIKCANNLGAGTAQGYGTEIELWGVRA